MEAIAVRQVSLSEEASAKLDAVLYPQPTPTMETWGTSRESIDAVNAARRFWDEHDPAMQGA